MTITTAQMKDIMNMVLLKYPGLGLAVVAFDPANTEDAGLFASNINRATACTILQRVLDKEFPLSLHWEPN